MQKKEIFYQDSGRIGKFKITHELLRSGVDRPMLQALFGQCIVLDSEQHESGRGVQYIAVSDLFQELKEGEEIPEYRIEFAHGVPFDNPELEARRVNSGAFGFVAVRQIVVRAPAVHTRMQSHAVH